MKTPKSDRPPPPENMCGPLSFCSPRLRPQLQSTFGQMCYHDHLDDRYDTERSLQLAFCRICILF